MQMMRAGRDILTIGNGFLLLHNTNVFDGKGFVHKNRFAMNWNLLKRDKLSEEEKERFHVFVKNHQNFIR